MESKLNADAGRRPTETTNSGRRLRRASRRALTQGVGAFLVVVGFASVCWAATQQGGTAADQGDVARGRYIVHHVAMCIYCHTPKNKQGELDESQLLMGAKMPVTSPWPDQQWAFKAPRLAGLPAGYTREEFIAFLMTGITPGGFKPKLPMPPFRMNHHDAASVAAYLASLKEPTD